MDENLKEYRKHLIIAEQKSQEDFDKTVLTLSGGALGVSIAFVKDIVGSSPIVNSWTLLFAWICWSLSLTSILISFYASQQALRTTIAQVDTDEIYETSPGGIFSKITSFTNIMGIVFFIIGIVFIVVFAFNNMV